MDMSNAVDPAEEAVATLRKLAEIDATRQPDLAAALDGAAKKPWPRRRKRSASTADWPRSTPRPTYPASRRRCGPMHGCA
jgi:hypothetical protein